MICPNCKSEYIDGITKCHDCGIDLIPTEDFVDVDKLDVPLEDWKEVYKSNDPIEAEMVKSNLEGAEIESVLFSKEDRMRINLSYVGSAPIKLYVRKKDFETALQIIKDINNTEIKDEE